MAWIDAKKKVKEMYTRLINLNVSAMLGHLYSKDVITAREKQIIQSTIPLESDKMGYLLDNIILPSLESGVIIKFKLFLEVMEESDDPVTRAIGSQLGMLNLMCIKYYSFKFPWSKNFAYLLNFVIYAIFY